MIMLLQKHIKITIRIPCKFFQNAHVAINNNKSTCTGDLPQQVAGARSISLGEVFLSYFPCIFVETNGYMTIDDNLLPKKEKT